MTCSTCTYQPIGLKPPEWRCGVCVERNANANNPRRLAVEAQAAKLRRTVGRANIETYIALRRKAEEAERLARAWRWQYPLAANEAAEVAAVEARGALVRFLTDLGVPEDRR